MKKVLIKQIEEYIFGKYDLRLNTVSNELHGRLKGEKSYQLFNEDALTYDLFNEGHNRFGQILPVIISTKVPKYDPIKEYFESLPKWDDSQPDYIQLLSEYVITEDKSWWQYMFKKHLVRMVAQGILKIPCNKQCFTFVGKQNDGKTSFQENLIPKPLKNYYRKNYDFHGSKDGKISLCQNFSIILDELAGYEKKDLNGEFKAVLTESKVKFRPLFAKSEVSHDRRANFMANTNSYEFLTDETGNVRWLIFSVKQILHDNGGSKGYEANVPIDLVWSQAYSLLMSEKFEFIMSNSDLEIQEKINQRFMRISTEMELIQRNFVASEKGIEGGEYKTVTDIIEYLKTITSLTINAIQIGKALKILKFQEVREYDKRYGYTNKGYYIKIISNHLT